MAKKTTPSMTDLFKRTEAGPAAQDIIKARGVGLKISEWAELEAIAQDLGKTKHAVSTYAVRYFLKAYRAGKIKTEARTTQNFPEL